MSEAIEENRRGHSIHLWDPGRSQIPIQNYKECHYNEHPPNLVSGDKIFQDSSKELGSSCTPKQIGDRSSDPWTRKDLGHPGNGNLELAPHWKRLWCWEGLGAGGEGNNRGWDGWMASLIQWTWVWVNSGGWWWTGRPGVLRFMGSQRVGHD